jgi:hypothetical protein
VEFTAAGAEAADNGSGEHKLYLCGLGNTHITGAPDTPPENYRRRGGRLLW